jgi:hypothetical protein
MPGLVPGIHVLLFLTQHPCRVGKARSLPFIRKQVYRALCPPTALMQVVRSVGNGAR